MITFISAGGNVNFQNMGWWVLVCNKFINRFLCDSGSDTNALAVESQRIYSGRNFCNCLATARVRVVHSSVAWASACMRSRRLQWLLSTFENSSRRGSDKVCVQTKKLGWISSSWSFWRRLLVTKKAGREKRTLPQTRFCTGRLNMDWNQKFMIWRVTMILNLYIQMYW